MSRTLQVSNGGCIKQTQVPDVLSQLPTLTSSPPPTHQVTLYIGNQLKDEEEALWQEMAAYGDVVRCFIVRDTQVRGW